MLFWSQEVLDRTVEQLHDLSYKLLVLDASKWQSIDDLHDDISSTLNFSTYYGRNFNALDDCLSDVAMHEYGSDAASTGTVLVFGGFGDFHQLAPDVAEGLLDIFANKARVAALVGHRMICLIQDDDASVKYPLVGGNRVRWNQFEFQDSRRR